MTQTRIVRERTRHDELFKGLMDVFLYSFLELFFPWLASMIEPGSLEPVNGEVVSHIDDLQSRRADLVYSAKPRSGEERMILHLEGQAQRVVDYPRRVFMYNSRLFDKYWPNKVVSIVVFGHHFQGEEPACLSVAIPFLQILHFQFLQVQLARLDWKKYRDHTNPIAAAFLSKMKYRPDEKVDVKLAYVKILTALNVSADEAEWIVAYFETYLQLNPSEELLFKRRIQDEFGQEVAEKMQKAESSYRLQGRKEGRMEEKFEIARNLLCLGTVSIEDILRVTQISKEDLTALHAQKPV